MYVYMTYQEQSIRGATCESGGTASRYVAAGVSDKIIPVYVCVCVCLCMCVCVCVRVCVCVCVWPV